jgi:predicted transcriptional regulator
MHDENPTRGPTERYYAVEQQVLYLLASDQPIWSVEDIGRHVGDQADVEDAVRGLHSAGLIHQTTDGFVFATRAGYRTVQIVGKVI